VSVALADHFKLINGKEYKNGKEMGSYLTFNIYSENSCSITSVAECGQQLEVITHSTPMEDGIPVARLRRDPPRGFVPWRTSES